MKEGRKEGRDEEEEEEEEDDGIKRMKEGRDDDEEEDGMNLFGEIGWVGGCNCPCKTLECEGKKQKEPNKSQKSGKWGICAPPPTVYGLLFPP
ncbi:hypothetical protein LOK49_LG10G00959 [Camellia lanceoleosa]|uniref:Uncharacterized protein n=1 Tax=Camellia lanceoleosa TaxID=1840588 RepID=A0ACC0GD10_9ERIC|nr:hypothetical protein LOK49_LG10G00959 [Camellia lanceoleosa]